MIPLLLKNLKILSIESASETKEGRQAFWKGIGEYGFAEKVNVNA